MGKLPDLDAFYRRQIVGARRMGHSISEIVRQLGFSRSTVSKSYSKYTDYATLASPYDFGSRRPTRVPWLNACHRAAHLAWARENRDWKRVAWSDESRFRLLNTDGWLRIWRQAHEAMDPACQVGTLQELGGSIMVWGVFLWHCLEYLVRVPTSLNAIRYVELLDDHLQPFMLFCYPHGYGVFQQDNFTLLQVPVGYWLVE
ncbi:transposable element Tcb2 transposase [Trichonephila clavipes]|nr:transposable element Tcb2 transposase [Trichonephila clavipes]